MKYLISDKQNFTYLPGIPGYGQKGAKGRQGNPGNGIYFASYNISENAEYALNQIQNNMVLSNNLNQSIDSSYIPQDIILDIDGNIYQLTNTLQLSAAISESALFSLGGLSSPFSQLQVRNNTSSFDSSPYYYLQENTKYDPELNVPVTNSIDVNILYPKFRRYASSKIAGNWLHFYIEPNDGTDVSKFSYTYTVILPDGISLQQVSDTNSCDIFIDNYYFYACSGIAELTYKNVNSPLNGKTVTDIINFQGIFNNNENTFEVSSAISEYISDKCKCYVDIKSKDTGVVYRLHPVNGISAVTNFASWEAAEYHDSSILFFNRYSFAAAYGSGIDNLQQDFTYLDSSLSTNNVLRLKFNSLSSIKLHIRINKYDKHGTNVLPAVKIYISKPMPAAEGEALTPHLDEGLDDVVVDNLMYTLLADGFEVYEWDGTNMQLSSNDTLDSAEGIIELELDSFGIKQGEEHYIDFGVTVIEVNDGAEDMINQDNYHTLEHPEVTIWLEDAELMLNE